ncbi:hypothetical protein ZIOFF_058305 [Zingiber officinale]|uniref:Polyprotein n=1 Tax=Zingiber officinale TaxID=94328 RepID=A0A8J5FAW3_ZINOF|nr:hypothetical protein ZIOFF_058305 [Zingiber officinale]
MKIGTPVVEFLGATIGPSTIKLQTHIISKIIDFKESELETLKGLRSWLDLLNYARSYIPNLGRLLGPLYSKTSPTGERRMNSQDWSLVRKIKRIISDLPDLAIPPEECFIILETDGCMEGWGDICKWKKKKEDPRTEEKICAYASEKYSPLKSTIDVEIHAYEELSRSRMPNPRIFGPQEKDLRAHLEDIEWTASRRVLSSIWELKLINNAKEAEFTYRGQLRSGLYFQDSLPETNGLSLGEPSTTLKIKMPCQITLDKLIAEQKSRHRHKFYSEIS